MTVVHIRTSVAAVLAAVALLGAACANDDGSGAAASTGARSGSSATAGTGSTGSSGGGGGAYGGGGGGRYDYGNGGGGSGNDGGQGSGGMQGDLTADNFAFAPTSVEAASGTVLHVENANAGTPHSFTVDGTSIDVTLQPGTVEDVRIGLDPGTYAFHCRFHASMTGTLTVT